MLIEARARSLTSAAEVLDNYRRTKSYFQALRAPEPPPLPTLTRNEEQPTPKNVPPPEVIPPKVFAVIDAVAERAGVTRERLISEVESLQIVEVRKIAIAVCSLSLGLVDETIARYFGVLPALIRIAVKQAIPIYLGAAIPSAAPLGSIIGVLFREWKKEVEPGSRPTVDQIKRAVCAEYGMSKCEMESERRTQGIAVPRQVAMALAKHLTLRSLPYVGECFGGRDHTTVLHACRKMAPHVATAAATIREGAPIEEWVIAVRQAYDASRHDRG